MAILIPLWSVDSLTQIVLGAASGEAVLGHKIGNRALLWGAVAGTLPDLDVFLSPFYHPVDALFIHRGFSHSLFFPLLMAPLLAFLFFKFSKKREVTFVSWTFFFFVSIFTHPLLDACTGYGTSLFLPFSEFRVDLNCIFIIDPLYTLPFLFCLILVMRAGRNQEKRKKWNLRGIYLSSAYLLFTFLHQQWMIKRSEEELARQEIAFTETKSFTTPFNSLLYGILARTDSGYYVGYRSVFDRKVSMEFHFHPSNGYLLEPWMKNTHVQDLVRFSKGWYSMEALGDTLVFSDLRFGQTAGWADPGAPFVFSMKLIPQPDSNLLIRKNDWRSDRMNGLGSLIDRITGK